MESYPPDGPGVGAKAGAVGEAGVGVGAVGVRKIVYASRIPPRRLEAWRLGGLEDWRFGGLDKGGAKVVGKTEDKSMSLWRFSTFVA